METASSSLSGLVGSTWRNILFQLVFHNHKRASLACAAAGGHFVSAGGSLRSPGVTLVNYKGVNTSKYVCPAVLIDIVRKITKNINF